MTELDRITNALRRDRLIGAWPPKVREPLAVASEWRSYEVGQYLGHADDPVDGWLLVTEGWVEASRTWRDGRRWVGDYLGAGQIANLMAALDGGPATFDLKAIEPTAAVFVPKAAVKTAQSDPVVADAIVRTLCRIIRLSDERHQANALNSMPVRVAKSLLYQAREKLAGGPPDATLDRITQDSIAGMMGVSRMSVVSALKPLQARGLVDTAYRRVSIRDPAGLVAFIVAEEAPSASAMFALQG